MQRRTANPSQAPDPVPVDYRDLADILILVASIHTMRTEGVNRKNSSAEALVPGFQRPQAGREVAMAGPSSQIPSGTSTPWLAGHRGSLGSQAPQFP